MNKAIVVASVLGLLLAACSTKPVATPPPNAPGVAGAGHTNPEAGATGGSK